ncbi:MAG: hypothetical protein OXD54_11645 [Candidatus Poribacteria bacterium]|nr:hypothetical protein [Candidatus Poribacteria bacterium]
MSYTTKFLISVFTVCILTIGAIFLWAQITKQKIAALPSINQQTETDVKPKRKLFLTKRHPRQHIIPKKQMLLDNSVDTNNASLLDNTVIPPVTFQTDVQLDYRSFDLNLKLPPILLQTGVQLDFHQFHPTIRISMIRLINMYNQGKLDLDYVVDYLESQHHFDPAILDKLAPRRAFRYIAGTSPSMSGTRSRNIAKDYAERILARDPDNPDAQLHMVRYEKDETKIIQRYKQILTQHPDHPNTLNALGYRLHDNSPEEALQYLKKANRLDPTTGIFSLGMVYEKLGDFKSAWFCYSKTVLIRERRKARFPPSRIHEDFFVDGMKMRDIEGGRQWRSVMKLVPDPNGDANRMVRTFQPVNAQQEREIREFYQFRDWVRNIENRKNLKQDNDFLVIEIGKHLNGGKPMFDSQRIVRAYEITTRHPGNEGIQRLKKTDLEIALEIERLLQQE